jgi:hypothetical protein
MDGTGTKETTRSVPSPSETTAGTSTVHTDLKTDPQTNETGPALMQQEQMQPGKIALKS